MKLISLFIILLSSMASGAQDYPIQLIKEGQDLKVFYIPTHICLDASRSYCLIEKDGKNVGHYQLVSNGRPLLDFIWVSGKSEMSGSIETFYFYANEVESFVNARPYRHYFSQSIVLEIAIDHSVKPPDTPAAFMRKLREATQYDGRYVIGTLKIGQTLFVILNNTDWGKREPDIKPPSPVGPTNCGDLLKRSL